MNAVHSDFCSYYQFCYVSVLCRPFRQKENGQLLIHLSACVYDLSLCDISGCWSGDISGDSLWSCVCTLTVLHASLPRVDGSRSSFCLLKISLYFILPPECYVLKEVLLVWCKFSHN